MTGAGGKGTVVLIALHGDWSKVSACLDSADQEGLGVVVFSTTQVAGRFATRIGASPESRAVAVASYPLNRVRGVARLWLSRVFTPLSSLVYRVTRAARHRMSLPPSADRVLEALGDTSRGVVPRTGNVVANRLIDPTLRVLGFGATKVIHGRVIVREVHRLMRTTDVVGVSCLDDPSLLPGWLLARRFPKLAVVAGYPEWWGERRDQQDLFEKGDTW